MKNPRRENRNSELTCLKTLKEQWQSWGRAQEGLSPGSPCPLGHPVPSVCHDCKAMRYLSLSLMEALVATQILEESLPCDLQGGNPASVTMAAVREG